MLSEVCPSVLCVDQPILVVSLVGAGVSQEDSSNLKFLYEGHEDFSVLPSFFVIPAQVLSSLAASHV